MKKEKSRLEQYVPLGINLAREVFLFVCGITCAILYSFSFGFQYMQAKNALYEIYDGHKRLIENIKISKFWDIAYGCFDGFGIYILCMIGIMIYHYIYHFQGSKMIYLMKRLPKRWDFYKRCLLLPSIAIIIGIIIMVVLSLIYYGIYLICTPYKCLPF